MIKVEFSNNYGDAILKTYPFLGDTEETERLFDFAYFSDEVESPLKNADPLNQKDHFVSLLITDDQEIQRLNKEYRDIDSPTDVLSFPQDELTIFGDIVISVPTLLRNAEELEVAVKDEYFRLLLHSFLHLLGYDHISNDFEKERMLIIQEKILLKFKKV